MYLFHARDSVASAAEERHLAALEASALAYLQRQLLVDFLDDQGGKWILLLRQRTDLIG